MEFKRFLVNKLILFFMLTTLITVVISVLGLVFDADTRFGYEALLTPIEFAALCILPSHVTWSRHELSQKQMLLRKALALLLIEAAVLFVVFRSTAIDTGRVEVVLAIAGSVLVIFVLAHLFLWLKDSADAKKMNRDLEKYQQAHE